MCNSFMSILTEMESTDTELLVYMMTLVNKVNQTFVPHFSLMSY